MAYFILFLICTTSVEIFVLINFPLLIKTILMVTKKVIYIIPNGKISDHWKEKVIPTYACNLMKLSIKILSIILFVISSVIIADIYVDGFLSFTLTVPAVSISIFLAMGYAWLRKFVKMKTFLLAKPDE